ncbi:putative tricarboxylic transport membrane protein [Anaerosolibacter carboniphilus]|uniref:Putative tricarboxylic transport membrane protein n=1 Tax=Anaerosolibacter carboniphilus TaxID=1417629 RepID=A0A841L656_9FIRM|nr:tripartite tricarboxylate transporter TctB family protein [Anaerosolibacter carboniphilus]MBB6218572.1 putative tricarboxylic transport membrane protein [Anaerosolibacter carboniphilus]
MSQIIAGIISLLIGSVWFFVSYTLDANNFGGDIGVGPVFFPRLLAMAMILLSIIHIIRTLVGKKNAEFKLKMNPLSVYMMIGCFAYLILMNFIGYVITTFLYVLVTIYLLSRRKSLIDVTSAMLVALCLYGVFHLLLHVPLPEGLLI